MYVHMYICIYTKYVIIYPLGSIISYTHTYIHTHRPTCIHACIRKLIAYLHKTTYVCMLCMFICCTCEFLCI